VNQKELADAAGVSESAINQNKKLPRVKNPDGSIFFDPEHPAVIAYLARKPRQRKQAEKAKAKKAAAPKPITETKVRAAAAKMARSREPEPKKRVTQKSQIDDLGGVKLRRAAKKLERAQDDFPDDDELDDNPFNLDALKTKEQIIKLKQDNAKARGDLIPRILVVNWIKHLFDADTNALKVLPDRIGSSLAMLARGAEDESTAGAVVRNFLSEEITRVIGGIKRVQKDFNKSLEPGVFDRAEKEEEQEAV